jgi:MSHA biogenesis protein MshI
MSWLAKTKKLPGWMAIGLYPERIDFAHVERRPSGRPVVKLLESYRREGNDADVLERLRRELSLTKYRYTTVLNQGEYRVVQVDAPGVPAAEAKTALRWSIKDRLDFPVETATIDAIEVPSEGGAGRARSMFAVAAGNELIAARQRLFAAAKVPLEVIDIPEMAQRNIANLFADGSRGVAMLAIDGAGGLLTFSAGGELCAFRAIDITLSQLSAADDEKRYGYFERIGLEVQRSLDNFDRIFSHSPLAKVLVAPTPEVPGLVEYLAGNLQVKTESFDLASVLDFPDVPELKNPARQLQCLQTLGAALRDASVPA